MSRFLALLLLAPLPAHADTHAVTVHNGGSDTIRAIQVGPAGQLGANRMRSQLPPGAEARITYSTGCQADVRLTYASGQTEDHAGLDLCSDPRITAGQPVAAASPAAAQPSAPPRPAQPASLTVPTATRGKPPSPAPQVEKVPVPPWTGHSITRRFGGMD